MDDATHRLLEIRAAKLARLRLLELRQAREGDGTDPAVIIEIEGLRRGLGQLDAAVASPLTADVVEELGQSGRYMATDTRLSHIERNIARLGAQLELFIEDTVNWRSEHRQWLIIITIVVVFVLMALVAIVSHLLTKGSL